MRGTEERQADASWRMDPMVSRLKWEGRVGGGSGRREEDAGCKCRDGWQSLQVTATGQ
jgi:hypothetical protein